jgi:hypothetical protein
MKSDALLLGHYMFTLTWWRMASLLSSGTLSIGLNCEYGKAFLFDPRKLNDSESVIRAASWSYARSY